MASKSKRAKSKGDSRRLRVLGLELGLDEPESELRAMAVRKLGLGEEQLSALRLARAATGRDRVIKFNGCYHGHGDSFLVKAGSGALTLGAPDSPGVPAALAELTLVAEYNDLASVEDLFEAHGGDGVDEAPGFFGCENEIDIP